MNKNILFITLVKIESVELNGIYTDLLKELKRNGGNLYVLSPFERREKKKTRYNIVDDIHFLNVKTFNIQKTNLLEKGIATLAIEYQFLKGIKKYFKEIKFDLIIYSTPPITFYSVIEYIKIKDKAKTYLLLKDIFPQNAVDMNMMKLNSLLHKYFRKKEKKMYEISDYIGCMSEANKKYLINNNPDLDPRKVEVNPNSIKYKKIEFDNSCKIKFKLENNIPSNGLVFIYGGNLGRPQGLEFLCETILEYSQNKLVFFLIIGNGTEYKKIDKFLMINKIRNAKLFPSLPLNEYNKALECADIGLIFLNKNFTIPNFPSRLLSYLEYSMPVIAVTDEVSDIGDLIEKNECGLKVITGDIEYMKISINQYINKNRNIDIEGKNGNFWLKRDFDVSVSCNLILKKLNHVQILS